MYQNTLDKSSKKFSCPNCTKRTFVKYVEIETGNYLADNFGRCDRESKCGYQAHPPTGKKAYLINFIGLKSITDKALKGVDLNGLIHVIPKSQVLELGDKQAYISEWFLKGNDCKISYSNCESKYFDPDGTAILITLKELPPPPPPIYIDCDVMEQSEERYTQNVFVMFLLNYFNTKEVGITLELYHIGTSKYYWLGATIFWQIDNNFNVRAGKIMLYDSNGKRAKEPYSHINWEHNRLGINNENVYKCLFGLHRMNEDYSKPIAIVESEKTAIIMSILLPNFIWMATAGKGNLKEELLRPLKNRKIILHPDKGEFKDWQKVVIQLKTLGYKIVISDMLEQMDFEQGGDLADYFINEKNQQ
jgi:hypothetical protein